MILTKKMTTIAIYNVIQGSTSQKSWLINLKENLQSQTKKSTTQKIVPNQHWKYSTRKQRPTFYRERETERDRDEALNYWMSSCEKLVGL